MITFLIMGAGRCGSAMVGHYLASLDSVAVHFSRPDEILADRAILVNSGHEMNPVQREPDFPPKAKHRGVQLGSFELWQEGRLPSVLLVRDPRDQLVSWRRMIDRIKKSQWHDSYKALADVRVWCQTWLRSYSLSPPARTLVVRFEDLMEAQSVEMQRICRHLGIGYQPLTSIGVQAMHSLYMSHRTTPLGTTPTGRWQNELEPHEAAEVKRICGRTMADHRYE